MVNYYKPKLPFFDNLVGNRQAGKQLLLLTPILIALFIFTSNKEQFIHTNIVSGTVLNSYSEKEFGKFYYDRNTIQFKVDDRVITTSTITHHVSFQNNEIVYIFHKTDNPYNATIWSFKELVYGILVYGGFFLFAWLITIYKICFN